MLKFKNLKLNLSKILGGFHLMYENRVKVINLVLEIVIFTVRVRIV